VKLLEATQITSVSAERLVKCSMLAAHQRAYHQANKEKVAAYQRAYYQANKEKVAAH